MPMTRIPLASSSSSEYRCIISQKWRYSASARRRVIALSTVWSPPCTAAYANTCSALVWLDQFTYRRLVVRAGVGVGAKQLHKLRVAELAAAIRSITPEMEARAEAMGRRARDEDGAAAVVRTVEVFLREKVVTGEWRDDFQERVAAVYD